MQEDSKQNNKQRKVMKTKDCYRLVKSENVENKRDIFRVSKQTNNSKLAFQIMKKVDAEKDKSFEVVAMGQTVVKLIKLVEFLKKTVSGLHMAYRIGSVDFQETYEPLYEGLVQVKTVTQKPAMFAYFSYNDSLLKKEPGYLVSDANIDKEASRNFVEKCKTYSYGQISQRKANYLNNKKEREQKDEAPKKEGEQEKKEQKERKPRQPREQREHREQKDQQEAKEPRQPREPRENKGPRAEGRNKPRFTPKTE